MRRSIAQIYFRARSLDAKKKKHHLNAEDTYGIRSIEVEGGAGFMLESGGLNKIFHKIDKNFKILSY